MAQSDLVGDFLEHHGIKGMKWGERKQHRDSHATHKAVWKETIAGINSDIPGINKRWEKHKGDLPDAYYNEFSTSAWKHLDKAGAKHGLSEDDLNKMGMDVKVINGQLLIKPWELQHSFEEGFISLMLTKDDNGRILKIDFPDELFNSSNDILKQSDLVGDFLEHHGVKGMKWGVRRNRSSGSSGSGGYARKTLAKLKKSGKVSSDKPVKPKKGDPGLEGKGHRPSDEGKQAAKILAKQKKHGTVALTNHELRTLNARQKLEQEFAKGNPPPKSTLDKGHEHIKKYLAIGMTAKAAYDLFNSNAGKALRGRGAQKVAEEAAKQAAQKAAQKFVWEQALKPITG
jgi:hypothetical protein